MSASGAVADVIAPAPDQSNFRQLSGRPFIERKRLKVDRICVEFCLSGMAIPSGKLPLIQPLDRINRWPHDLRKQSQFEPPSTTHAGCHAASISQFASNVPTNLSQLDDLL